MVTICNQLWQSAYLACVDPEKAMKKYMADKKDNMEILLEDY